VSLSITGAGRRRPDPTLDGLPGGETPAGTDIDPGMTPPRMRVLREPGTLKLVSIGAILLLWHVVAVMTGPLFLTTPWQTLVSLYDIVINDDLLSAAGDSLYVFAIGFSLAATTGVVVGILGGYFVVAGRLLDVPVTIMWSTPTVGLIPVMVMWVGLGTATQIIIVYLSALFPIIINTQAGVRTVEPTFLNVASVFGKSRWYTFTRVVVPAAAPHIGSGLRLGVGRAIIGVFVAELFTSTSGLGAKMSYYATFFQTGNYFAALVVFIAISMAVTALMVGLTRRWSNWRVDD
jgi:ABC-type nitrate/sulfonate/bicarbonate transport system permease component